MTTSSLKYPRRRRKPRPLSIRFTTGRIGFRIRTHTQWMTAAAMAQAKGKRIGHRSQRAAMRRQVGRFGNAACRRSSGSAGPDHRGRPDTRNRCQRTAIHAMPGCNLVGARGFEPPTPCSRSRCATKLRYAPTLGGGVKPIACAMQGGAAGARAALGQSREASTRPEDRPATRQWRVDAVRLPAGASPHARGHPPSLTAAIRPRLRGLAR
jgi:hypothetical protein